ncbi:MAG: hypothetical protein AAFX50_26940, partial [Acidobacteriota bacterium]
MRQGVVFVLEVAIRSRRIGIPYRGDPSPVALPPSEQPLELLAVLSADDEEFEITSGISTISVPRAGDSTRPARFAVKPLRAAAGPGPPPVLDLRLYCRLNLVEHLEIEARVAPRRGPVPPANGPPLLVHQRWAVRDYLQLRDAIQPKALGVHVTERDGLLDFRVTLDTDAAAPPDGGDSAARITASARTRLRQEDFEGPLRSIRDRLLQGVLKDFAGAGPAKSFHYRNALTDLAKSGRDLWVLLFRQRRGDPMWKLGELLAEHPPRVDAPIQVVLSPSALRLVVPWAFLYASPRPDPARGVAVDPE